MKRFFWSGVVFAVVLTGCSGVDVERTQASEQTELSGRWNANDSRLVADTMINALLQGPWLVRHKRDSGGRVPTVIVGDIRNLSHELISVETFITDIERALINSGQVSFVAGREEREALRDERLQQEMNTTESTRKEMGREIGADYMMVGTINSFVERHDDVQNIQYQVDLKLINLENNITVWVDSQKHAKTVTRGKFKL